MNLPKGNPRNFFYIGFYPFEQILLYDMGLMIHDGSIPFGVSFYKGYGISGLFAFGEDIPQSEGESKDHRGTLGISR